MKIEIADLVFNSDFFYVQSNTIVEKIIFNNRTFYSKYKKQITPIDATLIQQHYKHEISLAIPLIEKNLVHYIVIEYYQKDWNLFYSLLKHLLKSLNINNFQAYQDINRKCFQLFIPKESLSLELAYKEVENIKHLLEIKSKQSYKIYPNRNLPKNLNIINLPTQKV